MKVVRLSEVRTGRLYPPSRFRSTSVRKGSIPEESSLQKSHSAAQIRCYNVPRSHKPSVQYGLFQSSENILTDVHHTVLLQAVSSVPRVLFYVISKE